MHQIADMHQIWLPFNVLSISCVPLIITSATARNLEHIRSAWILRLCMPSRIDIIHIRSRLSEVSMSLWIRLCNHTYIHTYNHLQPVNVNVNVNNLLAISI